MGKQNTIDLHSLRISTRRYSLAELCFPHGLSRNELQQLDTVIEQQARILQNHYLFRENHRSEGIYTVLTGSFKLSHITSDGHEQILGFSLPGEIMGLDALADNYHHCEASALTDSTVCRLALNDLEKYCLRLPGLQQQLRKLMCGELIVGHEMITLLGKKDARGRLATLLISLSKRLRARGQSPIVFNLPMSRSDIANYLGVTIETVSRTLKQLSDNRLIRVRFREVEILDLAGLQALVDECD